MLREPGNINLVLDCLIRGGTVIDGTGGPPRVADVGLRDGRIVTVGYDSVSGREVAPEGARRTIDATGLVVAPGFVDLHTHYDAQLFWDPTASPSALHGVTTVIGGNCGFTLAPAGPDHAEFLMRMMARVEGMPLAALETGLPWDWVTFEDWLSRLDKPLGVNAGFLVGHSALRRAVMGGAATGMPASPEQVEQMVALLQGALRAGALGFSSSQSPTHNDGDGQPVPSRYAEREETLALAAAVADHPGTTLEVILAGCLNGFTDDEIDLMTAMSLAANRPVNWNVLGVSAANPEAHERQLDASTRAAARGAKVVALTLPHQMRIRLSFLTGFVLDGLPGWRETFALDVPSRLAALHDPEVRRRLAEGARSKEAGILRGLARWERLEIVETFAPANEGLAGMTVGDAAASRGKAAEGDRAFEFLLDVVLADELLTGLQPTMSETAADWKVRAEVWRDPRTVIGGSDAGAHLDMMCGAVYSTSLLGEAVRDRQLLTIEEAVHQLTDIPARLYGLRHRGRIAPGWHADLTLFDPARVGPKPARTRHDLPGSAPRLFAEAEGIAHVLVGGVGVVRDGTPTGDLPGTLLRSGQDTDTVVVPGS